MLQTSFTLLHGPCRLFKVFKSPSWEQITASCNRQKKPGIYCMHFQGEKYAEHPGHEGISDRGNQSPHCAR